MAENTLKAADNAAKANDLLAQATAEPEAAQEVKIVAPSDVLVNLPGGLVIDGEIVKTAEVRELTGRDEEAIARAGRPKIFTTMLNRATKSIGSKPASEDLLDSLLVGDRTEILLGIYRATFGNTAEVPSWCEGCESVKTVEVDVLEDVKRKVILDPVADTTFTVKGKKHEFLVTLPTGVTEKRISANPDMSIAESVTILLEQTVLKIDGQPVFSKAQIQNLGVMDRRAIADEITSRTPGPQFDDLTVKCPDCEGEVQVPINLGTLFRL